MLARERLVLPLDVPTLDDARGWVTRLAAEVGVFKVGLELFTAVGPDAVRMVHDAGAACFLDLKLHDIPATVSHAVESAMRLGARYLTVHAANGPTCLARAAETARGGPTRLLAVTVLTSLDAAELAAIGVAGTAKDAAVERATMAARAGIDGLVCSPQECAAIRELLGADVLLAVPGVRPSGEAAGDQKRVATPGRAIEDGADLLVVGRPIRDAADPIAAARAIVAEIARARAGIVHS